VYVAKADLAASEPFPEVDTAYVHVVDAPGGRFLPLEDQSLLLANFGGHGRATRRRAAALRHGRSNALPKSFFGAVDEKHHVSAQ